MRRAITVSLAAAAIAAAALVGGVSSAGGESGPACADITDATTFNYSYNASTSTGTLGSELKLRDNAPACKQITYTLVISAITGLPRVVTQKVSAQFSGVTFSDSDNRICVSATTSASGGHVHDAAPNAGCLELVAPTTGGGSGFS